MDTQRFVSNAVNLGTAAEAACHFGGEIIAIAINFSTQKAWINCWTGASWAGWNQGETSPNPDSGTGGVAITGSGTYMIGLGLTGQSTANLTLNVGATSFVQAPNATTFTAWH